MHREIIHDVCLIHLQDVSLLFLELLNVLLRLFHRFAFVLSKRVAEGFVYIRYRPNGSASAKSWSCTEEPHTK